jgi:hypothetical protein
VRDGNVRGAGSAALNALADYQSAAAWHAAPQPPLAENFSARTSEAQMYSHCQEKKFPFFQCDAAVTQIG